MRLNGMAFDVDKKNICFEISRVIENISLFLKDVIPNNMETELFRLPKMRPFQNFIIQESHINNQPTVKTILVNIIYTSPLMVISGTSRRGLYPSLTIYYSNHFLLEFPQQYFLSLSLLDK